MILKANSDLRHGRQRVSVQAMGTNKSAASLFESVGCICLVEDTILLLKRREDRSYPGAWGLPGGRIERGESAEATILREVYEETGLIRSPANLSFVNRFLVENAGELPFAYSTFITKYERRPRVMISASEHLTYEWVSISELHTRDLVPGTLECVLPMLEKELDGYQPALFAITDKGSEFRSTGGKVDDLISPSPASSRLDLSKTLVVVGPPGVGKTTLVKALAGVRGAPTAHYDILRDRQSRMHDYLHRFLNGDNSFALLCQVEALASRYWSVLSRKSPPAILDEWIYSTWAYSKALAARQQLRPEEYQTFYVTYASYNSFVVPPRLVVHLTAPPEELRTRIERRGRDFERRSHDRDYLASLVAAFTEVARELRTHTNVITIQTAGRSASSVYQEVIERARDLELELD